MDHYIGLLRATTAGRTFSTEPVARGPSDFPPKLIADKEALGGEERKNFSSLQGPFIVSKSSETIPPGNDERDTQRGLFQPSSPTLLKSEG